MNGFQSINNYATGVQERESREFEVRSKGLDKFELGSQFDNNAYFLPRNGTQLQ